MTALFFATPAPSSKFSLRDHFAAVCDSNPTIASPAELARIALDTIDPRDYYDALAQALPSLMSSYVAQNREVTTETPSTATSASASPSAEPSQDNPNGGDELTVQRRKRRKGKRHVGRSKLAATPESSATAVHEDSRWYVPLRRGWAFLRELTIPDFESMVAFRSNIVATHLAMNEALTAAADALRAHHATAFGDLPAPVQTELADALLRRRREAGEGEEETA